MVMSRAFLRRLASAAIIALAALATGPGLGRVSGGEDLSTQTGSAVQGLITSARRIDLGQLPPANGPAARAFVMPYLSPYPGRASATQTTATKAPKAGGPKATQAAQVLLNFDALNIGDDANANSIALGAGFILEPPDQGLCVGPQGVLETVNDVVGTYSLSGDRTSIPVALSAFFAEPPQVFISDPRCYYDPQSKAFFATALVVDNLLEPVSAASHQDIAVNTSGNPAGTWTVFQFDTTDPTTPGCPCFGDQPLLGVDSHGVYVSTNEFAIAAVVNPLSDPTGFLSFHGAQVYAVDKAQLIAFANSTSLIAPSVFFVHYSGMQNGGVVAASMEPATASPASSPAEYFLDSLDPNATTDDRLGVWALTNQAALDSGGIPTLSGIVINSQVYGQPPLAQEKQPSGSNNVLNTDDDRMLQVQNVDGTLWGALNTVVLPSGDTAIRSGAAWFRVTPSLSRTSPARVGGATVTAQGIVAIPGTYLLYPAIGVNAAGNAAMIFDESSSTIYPTVAFATGSGFTSVQTLHASPTFDVGFTCSPCRWGDYSAAVASSVQTSTIWMATEDLMAQGFSNANWSTRITEVVPQGG
jgi:hypothetical protein